MNLRIRRRHEALLDHVSSVGLVPVHGRIGNSLLDQPLPMKYVSNRLVIVGPKLILPLIVSNSLPSSASMTGSASMLFALAMPAEQNLRSD